MVESRLDPYYFHSVAMALVESAAAFEQRCDELNNRWYKDWLEEPRHNLLQLAGICSGVSTIATYRGGADYICTDGVWSSANDRTTCKFEAALL